MLPCIGQSEQHKMSACRDAEGGQPLYWGATDEGQLLLGSHLNDLDGCEPTATMFPPGARNSSNSSSSSTSERAQGHDAGQQSRAAKGAVLTSAGVLAVT